MLSLAGVKAATVPLQTSSDISKALHSVEESRGKGAVGADEIYRQLRRLPYSYRPAAFQALSSMHCPRAEEILLEIAKGSLLTGTADEEAAAAYFLASVDEPVKAKLLLSARNTKLWSQALQTFAAANLPLDDDLASQVANLLAYTNLEVRASCAQYLKAAQDTQHGPELLRAIILSLQTMAQCPRYNERVGFAHEFGAPWTQEGLAYTYLLGALQATPSITTELLQAHTPAESGTARYCLIIARACRGDDSVKESVVGIATTCSNARLRFEAVRSLRALGKLNTGDTAVLRKIAETDELSIELSSADKHRFQNMHPLAKVPDRIFPIRDCAASFLASLEARTPPSTK